MKRLRYMLAGLLVAVGALPAVAGAQAVSESYAADSQLQAGLIVRLAEKDSKKVVVASAEEAEKAIGVVVAPNETPISLGGNQNKLQVNVATTGNYRVLVSDQNGPIQKDDYIAISSLTGVGMRADGAQGTIIGKASTLYDGRTNVAGTTTVTDSNGVEKTIRLGYVTTSISIARNPLQRAVPINMPAFLQKASEGIAQKPVSPVRVYFSLAVLLITASIVASLLYSGVRTSMISLGRNPLARGTIMRSLVRIVLISLIVLSTGLGAVYLLLRI